MTGLVETAARMLGARVAAVAPLAGGDLSPVFRLTLADGRRVIAKPGVTATAEAAMLRTIAATGAPAPAVIAVSDALLLMEDVAAGEGLAAAWGDLARAIGLLHAATGPNYGWDRDHAFGPLPVSNGPMDHWPTFWAERRVLCHVPASGPIARAGSSGSQAALTISFPATRPPPCFMATCGAATS